MHLLLLASLQCGLARPAQYLTSYELKLREHANIIKHQSVVLVFPNLHVEFVQEKL